jgi:riboflavin kinase/FMN adenylyltransferase
MQHYHSIDDVFRQDSWLTIGVFDGVHRGHREIIRKLTAGARAERAPAVVLTFDPHPAVVLGGAQVKCLTTPDERAGLLAALGIEVVITQPFDAALASLSAREFMSQLQAHLGLKHLLIGYDFALGKGREGNAARLSELGLEMGYRVEVVPAVSDESGVISSTEIRKLVAVGSVAEAAGLLGHPYSLEGPIIHGAGRGRAIGIPTANIDYPRAKVIPANGIYAGWATLGQDKHPALISIGINPTFTPENQTPSVEAYLLDLPDRDLYGQNLRLEFVERLRDEIKFDSVEALVEQIQADIVRGRELLLAG